jgi:hypothetical protein
MSVSVSPRVYRSPPLPACLGRGFEGGQRADRVTPCLTLSHLKNSYQGDARYQQLIANGGTSTYRVYVGRNAFEGRIDGYPGEGMLAQHWVDGGTAPCPESQVQP